MESSVGIAVGQILHSLKCLTIFFVMRLRLPGAIFLLMLSKNL